MSVTRQFVCETCEDKPEFDHAGKLLYHLQELHHILPAPGRSGPEGMKTTTMCLDGAGWSENTYQWTFGAGQVSVVERCRQERYK